nr:MAG TPA: hypothetical protein [Caudoviricetes sp.]
MRGHTTGDTVKHVHNKRGTNPTPDWRLENEHPLHLHPPKPRRFRRTLRRSNVCNPGTPYLRFLSRRNR